MSVRTWGFKSPLRHHLIRANPLVMAIWGSGWKGSEGHSSAICQQRHAGLGWVTSVLGFRIPGRFGSPTG